MPYVIRLLGCIRLLKPMGAVAATDQLIPLASTQSYLTDALAAISERTKQQLDNGTLTTAYNLLTFPEKNRKKTFSRILQLSTSGKYYCFYWRAVL